MSLSTTPSLDSSVRPSFASGYASPLTGGMAHPDLWDGVVGAWCPSLGATGGTLRDLSGNHNHGTLTNMDPATDWVPDGLDFDDTDDWIDTPLNCNTYTDGDYTHSAWVKTNGTSGTQKIMADWAGNRSTLFRISNGNLQFYVGDGSSTLSGNVSISFSAYVGKLTHVVARHQASTNTLTVYINGKQAGTNTYTGTAGTSDSDLYFSTPSGEGEPFDGVMDGFIVHNRALTANEIAKLYRLGPAGLYQQKRPVITTGGTSPTVEPAGSVGAFIRSEVKPSYSSGYASPITGGMAHESLWDGVVGAWCPSLGATGGTLRNLSGRNNHGTLTNMDPATDWLRTGVNFDGVDDHVLFDPVLASKDFAPCSFSFWCVIDSNVSTKWLAGEGGIVNGGAPIFGVYMTSGPTLQLYTRNDAGTTNLIGGTTVPVGELTQCTSTCDGNTAAFYVNGRFRGSASVTGNLSVINTAIGCLYRGGPFYYFPGTIDDFVIHNRPLTANEIAKLYRLGPAGLYQRKQPVITTAEEVVGGLSIPIAAYHYNHNVGSRL